MPNKRIFYAVRQVGFAKDGTSTYIEAHGVQSMGITTNFNLEQVFEMGQLSIYQTVEQIPDIEVTMEKVLDGYPLLYHLATNGAASGSLIGRSNVRTIVAMSVFADTSSSASGTPIAEVQMSGLFVSAVTYTFPVDGNATEALTLVGNNKVWLDDETTPGGAVFTGRFNNLDSPLDFPNSGGVQRREHLVMIPGSAPQGAGPTGLDINGAVAGFVSVFPTDLPGITASGTNPTAADGTYLVPLQNITISCDLGRDSIFELGRKSPYFRYVTFPVEVRTEIDNISGTEAGGQNGALAGYNTRYNSIRVYTQDGTSVDTGLKNRLTTVTVEGGDAGGGGNNVTHRYTYVTFNDLMVSHPQDPSGL
jgi:hypothetical protein